MHLFLQLKRFSIGSWYDNLHILKIKWFWGLYRVEGQSWKREMQVPAACASWSPLGTARQSLHSECLPDPTCGTEVEEVLPFT